ncbi:MAG: phosphatidylglycerol lysyltransferase domain-containing protein, partial [Pseudomonadota bacterium]
MRVFWVNRAKVGLRILAPLVILGVCAVLISDKLTVDMLVQLPGQLAEIALWQWAVAAVLTAVSLWSVGQYDVLAHRYLRTGVPAPHARLAGTIGIAVGQTLGFGLFTGAIARWRMLPGLRLGAALRLSAFVSVSFVVAWVAVTSVMALALPAPAWARWLALPGLAAGVALAAALFWWPRLTLAGRAVTLPNLPLSGGIIMWVVVDTLAAAGALYVMLPSGAIGFADFYPLFLIAMGTALLSNTPGGMGPFELVLLTALPQVGPSAVLAAILAYRIVYYAVPAALAALALLRPFPRHAPVAPPQPIIPTTAPRSEVGVVRQNGGDVVQLDGCAAALWPTGQTLTLFTDPVAGPADRALRQLMRAAQQTHALPLLYKCGPRLAAVARASGWRVLHVADDAVINLDSFSPATPARRTLRRKLRAADKAGVTLTRDGPLPYAAMAQIDTDWQARNGPARGGSMGRYCPEYLVDQWVGCAFLGDRLVAFVSCHKARDEWCLDLMRQGADTPDGTMHALVHAGIEAARTAGARQFNMAATPACPDAGSAFWRWVASQVVARSGGPGLRQFKSNFAPAWKPRYAAAQGVVALTLGLADITRAIHKPLPLGTSATSAPHKVDENYELASRDVA